MEWEPIILPIIIILMLLGAVIFGIYHLINALFRSDGLEDRLIHFGKFLIPTVLLTGLFIISIIPIDSYNGNLEPDLYPNFDRNTAANNSPALNLILRNIERGDRKFEENYFIKAAHIYRDSFSDLKSIDRITPPPEYINYIKLLESELSLKIKINRIARLSNRKNSEKNTLP